MKFRVGKIVYVSVSPDESTMGFGFPKEERDALIAAEPEKFAMPRLSDQRFHWVHVRMAALDQDEMQGACKVDDRLSVWRISAGQQWVPGSLPSAVEQVFLVERYSYGTDGKLPLLLLGLMTPLAPNGNPP